MSPPTFIQKSFAEYYTREYSLSSAIKGIEQREFGFGLFGRGMLRHKKVENAADLEQILKTHAPSDSYYSCAYYEDPEAEMDKKGWRGADLIFDIDADHIVTACDKNHDAWACCNCGSEGRGPAPEKCPKPKCRSERFNSKTWPCEACLESAKEESIRLLDMLLGDFGFTEKDVHVFFSGHRGYHVHVEDESIRGLDTAARKEIVDYIYGLGFDALARADSFSMDASGWYGRTAKAMSDLISHATKEDYRKIGLKANSIESLIKNRDVILKSWGKKARLRAVKGLGPETLRKIAESCGRSQAAAVDTVVTTDIHRLIRLPDSLHSKTGFKKVEFCVSEIEDFDPFKSAIAFRSGETTVLVSSAPEFRIGDQVFPPYCNQRVELPTAAAVLLVCRGRGEVVELSV